MGCWNTEVILKSCPELITKATTILDRLVERLEVGVETIVYRVFGWLENRSLAIECSSTTGTESAQHCAARE
jgi:hypothetical protein